MPEETDPPVDGAPRQETGGDGPASRRLVAQFIVFPFAIVIVGVAIYMLLGLLTEENRTPRDFLNAIHTGGINSRWQAAFELSRQLSAEGDAVDAVFAGEIARVFVAATDDDPRVRRFLARAMGRVPHPEVVVTPLIDALSDPDAETQIYAALSLGTHRDPRALAALTELAGSDDPGLRKAAMGAMGQIDADAASEPLRAGLGDPVADVRWNAALQLARGRDSAAVPVLLQMLNREDLDTIPGMTEEQKRMAMVRSIQALAHLEAIEAVSLFEQIRDRDPDMKVRQAAIEALETIQK